MGLLAKAAAMTCGAVLVGQRREPCQHALAVPSPPLSALFWLPKSGTGQRF